MSNGEILVIPFQLMQWKSLINAQIRSGHPVKIRGKSVKAHAAKHFGLSPRAKAEDVLERVEAALQACVDAGVPMTATVGITQD